MYRKFYKSLTGKPAIYTFIIILPFLVFYWQVPFLADMTIGNDYTGCTIQEQMELQYALAHGFFPLYVLCTGVSWGANLNRSYTGADVSPISAPGGEASGLLDRQCPAMADVITPDIVGPGPTGIIYFIVSVANKSYIFIYYFIYHGL